MKHLLITLMLLTTATSNLVAAKVYKCKGASGNIVYKSQPCDSNSQIELKTKIKADRAAVQQSAHSPVGRWVVESNPRRVASLSSAGVFSMTDHEGTAMRGRWSENNGNYVINASFQGVDMGIKMRYNAETDTLSLSKPGFPSRFSKYKRRS